MLEIGRKWVDGRRLLDGGQERRTSAGGRGCTASESWRGSSSAWVTWWWCSTSSPKDCAPSRWWRWRRRWPAASAPRAAASSRMRSCCASSSTRSRSSTSRYVPSFLFRRARVPAIAARQRAEWRKRTEQGRPLWSARTLCQSRSESGSRGSGSRDDSTALSAPSLRANEPPPRLFRTGKTFAASNGQKAVASHVRSASLAATKVDPRLYPWHCRSHR